MHKLLVTANNLQVVACYGVQTCSAQMEYYFMLHAWGINVCLLLLAGYDKGVEIKTRRLKSQNRNNVQDTHVLVVLNMHEIS